MRLLLFGGAPFTRKIVERLFGKARHSLEWRKSLESDKLDVSRYDMLLIDGFPGECNDKELVSDVVQTVRAKAPEMPIMVLSFIEGEGEAKGCGRDSGNACRIVESRDGTKLAKCRLRELALSEVGAFNAFGRLPMEPITFVFQG